MASMALRALRARTLANSNVGIGGWLRCGEATAKPGPAYNCCSLCPSSASLPFFSLVLFLLSDSATSLLTLLWESQRASELDPPPRGRVKPQRGLLPEPTGQGPNKPGAASGNILHGPTGPGQGPNNPGPGAIGPKPGEHGLRTLTFRGHKSWEFARIVRSKFAKRFKLLNRVSPIN